MGFNLENYIKRSSKDAFSRISDDVSNRLRDAATNAVSGALGKGLKAIGLSNKIVNDVTSRFADSVRADLAAEWYQTTDPVMNRLSGEGIRNNRTPGAKGLATKSGFEKDITEGENWAGRDPGKTSLAFPKDNLGRYYCAFEFREYERPAPQLAATPKALKTIFLPMPRNLVETHGISYETPSLGSIGGVADALQKGEGLGNALGATAGDTLLKKLQNVNVLDTGVGEAAVTFIQQAYGFAANPHLSVLFKGGTLREHTFRWLLAPESPDESREIKDIINHFRIFSLPSFFGDTNAVFDYPKMCKVRFFPWASGNPSGANNPDDLYTIKQCMIKNIVVNYAPNGIPSFFAGTNQPTMIEFEVQLQEIEYFTAQDYNKGTKSDKSAAAVAEAVEKALGSTAGSDGTGAGSESTRGNQTTKTRAQQDTAIAAAGSNKYGTDREVAEALKAAEFGRAAPFRGVRGG